MTMVGYSTALVGPTTCPSTALSKREWEVLTLVAQGYQLPEVAEVLVISYYTAHSHAQNIRQKLGAATLARAVFVAFVQTNSSAGTTNSMNGG